MLLFDKSVLRNLPLRSERLTLRKLKLKDIEPVYNILLDREVSRNIGVPGEKYYLKYARGYVRQSQIRLRKLKEFELAVERNEDSQFIGAVGLFFISHRHKTGWIGYWFGRSFWRRGYASESVKILCDFAFRVLDLHHLTAEVFGYNQASMRLLEKLGWTREVVLRKAELIDNKYYDLVRYGLLAEEFMRNNSDLLAQS